MVTSSAEAGACGLFHAYPKSVQLINMLITLNHPQPATPTKTNNSACASFFKGTLKKNRSKAWDNRYHWLIDQSELDKIFIYWEQGLTIMPIIILNIIHHHIIEMRDPLIF